MKEVKQSWYRIRKGRAHPLGLFLLRKVQNTRSFSYIMPRSLFSQRLSRFGTHNAQKLIFVILQFFEKDLIEVERVFVTFVFVLFPFLFLLRFLFLALKCGALLAFPILFYLIGEKLDCLKRGNSSEINSDDVEISIGKLRKSNEGFE